MNDTTYYYDIFVAFQIDADATTYRQTGNLFTTLSFKYNDATIIDFYEQIIILIKKQIESNSVIVINMYIITPITEEVFIKRRSVT